MQILKLVSKYRANIVLSIILVLSVNIFLTACSQQEGTNQAPLVYPEDKSEAAKLYLKKCGGCHAAPLPGIHLASRWPGVIHRMQQRMTAKAIKPLDQTELAIIISYLQKYARDAKK